MAATWPLILHPATLWPRHHDARVFTWVMASIARRLLTHPLALFDANIFYPYGGSLAFTELLFPPSLLGLPGFLWGDPVLTYNLLLLGLWPLNGLAMAWVAHQVTGSRAGAWLAGAVFCLSPYFTGYYLEFQMLLAALLPVVMLAWVRWLETHEVRWLVLVLGGLSVQGLTTWYYAIILGLGLVVLGLGFLCLRWRGWRWRRMIGSLLVGGLAVTAVLLPFALPYWAVHRELGYERSVEETAQHSADLLTFVEAGPRSLLYRGFSPTRHIAETSAFVGVSVLALAVAGLGWLRRDAPAPAPAAALARVLCAALLLSVVAVVACIVFSPLKVRLGPLKVSLRPQGGLQVALALGCVLLLVRGWAASRLGDARRLGEGDWVRLLLLLTGVFALLALGPVIRVAWRPVGTGPYAGLYDALLPLHVIRVASRFAIVSTAGLALLAAFGLSLIGARLRTRPGRRRLVVAAVFLALGMEYAVAPAPYEAVAWAPRPVDTRLRSDPDDVAVLEWPINVRRTDADAMVSSLAHGKRLINGVSGVLPNEVPRLSRLWTLPGPPFPVPEALAETRRIYPLRYLVVRFCGMTPDWRGQWRALRDNPPPELRFLGSFGEDDLYEIVALPEQGVRFERRVSRDFLLAHPVLSVSLRPRTPGPGLDEWVDVEVNGRLIQRVSVPSPSTARLRLSPPFHRIAPNVVTLSYGYRRLPSGLDERHRIGATGVLAPGDLRVVSRGQLHGRHSSIRLNGVELSPNHRGYNLVALDPAGGLLGAAWFDTFFEDTAAERLAAWVRALPRGTIVAGSVKDEASGRLTQAAVQALGGLGVAGDLRGRFREAHAFVGVQGAPPGSALEALGPRPLELLLGYVEHVELTGFALTPPSSGE
jgi:hypothetical protein